METFFADIVAVLKKELNCPCHIFLYMDQVILEISDFDFEKRMGCLIQQIHQLIDKHCPMRHDNLSIIIRNREKLSDNRIKIWRTI